MHDLVVKAQNLPKTMAGTQRNKPLHLWEGEWLSLKDISELPGCQVSTSTLSCRMTRGGMSLKEAFHTPITNRLTEEKKHAIVSLIAEGYSEWAVAQRLKCSNRTVRKVKELLYDNA